MKENALKKANVFKHFKNVSEFRQVKKIKHLLIDIIVITVCAVVSGADTFSEVELFMKYKEDWLKSILALPGGIPSHDTIERVFRMINPEEFRRCFLSWVREISEVTNGEVVAIDGKTIRGSADGNRSPIHIVSAWSRENGIVLGQTKVKDKSNEIIAIPELLKVLELKGCIVTIDAMGCQKKIAKEIRNKNADYVLALKENHGSLHDDVVYYFEDAAKRKFRDIEHDFYVERDKGHGRQEVRKYWITDDIKWLYDREKWADLKCIGCIESSRTVKGEKSTQKRYFITSLDANAKEFARAARGHWSIENSLHWVLDVVFKEDKLQARKDNAPENLAVIRHVALNIMKNDKETKLSLRRKRLSAEWSHDYMVKIVFGDISCEIN